VQYKQLSNQYMLRLDSGEDFLNTISGFCEQKGIKAAKVSGIGAVRDARISYFDLQKGEYISIEVPGDVELLSLMGNISIMEGQVFAHLHVTLADENFKVHGGHFSAGKVGATAEIFIEVYDLVLERKFYQETGLRLLVLDDK
jgi:predicted DNA-binding protein with PD1-like motif